MKVQEAIEVLKQFLEDTPKLPYDCIANKEIEAVSVLLNEYEKQQKEIQKLEARKYMFNAKTGEVKVIPTDGNYISKDKIKEKIDEYVRMIEGSFTDITWYGQNRRDNCFEIIQVLKELLEEQ